MGINVTDRVEWHPMAGHGYLEQLIPDEEESCHNGQCVGFVVATDRPAKYNADCRILVQWDVLCEKHYFFDKDGIGPYKEDDLVKI